ncbi:hypothetical protein evm_015418, partial [Chilo suppressalis]
TGHLVNVVRGSTTSLPPGAVRAGAGAGESAVPRGGNALPQSATPRAHRVSLSLDARHLVRAAIPTPRAQIQLKNRTVQVSAAGVSTLSGLTGNASCSKTGLPSAVVASLVQKWSVIGWVIKNLLSLAPPCFGRHVKPLVPAASAVGSTRQSALGPCGGSWPNLPIP